MATIRKRGNRYHVQIRLKGFEPETASFPRLTDAKAWASKTETDMRSGRHFGQSKRHTFNELADGYLVDVVGELKNVDHRTRHINHWRKVFGAILLDSITPDRIKKERTRLLGEKTHLFTTPVTGDPKVDAKRERGKRKGATVNRMIAALSACLSYGVREKEWLEKNPCSNVKKYTEDKGRVRFLSDDERICLLDACRPNADLYLAVVMSLTTGARQGEIMSLRWGQINFSRKTISLYKTKNGDARTLPLVGEAFNLLQDRTKVRNLKDDRIFPPIIATRKTKYLDLRVPWAKALKTATINDFHWHDLRHTAASNLAMMGVSMVELARLLGHRTLSMVVRYSHLSSDHIVSTGEKLAARLGVDK